VNDDGRQTWRVGFYVEVEVEAYEGEAAIVAEEACHWPGTWSPPRAATETSGRLNGKPVKARILRSRALMVKPVAPRPDVDLPPGVEAVEDGWILADALVSPPKGWRWTYLTRPGSRLIEPDKP
jgi:hypothetical protein